MVNETINGYLFTDFIGSGSFGSVYKATREGKTYAIKVFREEYIRQEYLKNGKSRILREIQIIKSINSPYLIKYEDDFSGFELDVPSYFLVMEYADGITLKNLIINDKLLTEDEIITIFINIVKGVKALHEIRGDDNEKGIIHRDLKPENILVDKNNNIKILDYGLSKVIDYTTLTSTGNFLGSPVYASPEQIIDSNHIDKRSDLYSLGVIFYEMLTKHYPYIFNSLPNLIDKIKNSHPIPPRKYNNSISNKSENIILKLLEKEPFKRFRSVNDLLDEFRFRSNYTKKKYDLSPRFLLRVWNDKSVLEEFVKRYSGIIHIDFPALHQFQQQGLLEEIRKVKYKTIIDPETFRFAYSTYINREGLKRLPYCPENFQVITPSYLSNYTDQQKYVRQVIDMELALGADILVAPYHYTHNTSVVPTYQNNPVEQWFDLDIKLLRESVDYKNSLGAHASKPIYAGICINSSSLVDNVYKNDLLNYYTSTECDGYIVYADGIDKNVNEISLFNYIDTLKKLQNYTERPVIAGRLNPAIGIGMLSLGLSGFSSGAARFETFYEELYSEDNVGYNLHEKYYFPQLLNTISVDKKLPTRLNEVVGVLGKCTCPYCSSKPIEEIILPKSNKLHYLYWMNMEISNLQDEFDNGQNVLEYYIERVESAIENYKRLRSVFKPEEYKYLEVCKKVFSSFSKAHV